MTETIALGTPAVRRPRIPTRQGQGYFIRTFGCQMNEHDSERIAGLLEADGMVPVDRPERADVVILNTCTIRENADERLRGYLGALRAIKRDHTGMQIAVGGCMAQKDREGIAGGAEWVDVVFGTHNTHRVVDLLDHAAEWGPITEILDETESVEAMPSALPAHRRSPHTAWVTITIGCNNSCTFCIVPAVRGREISRRPGDILAEVRQLAESGVTEVTLLGQNVNSYGRDLELNGRRPLFADLLRRVGAVDGIRRVRYTSPHPKDFREDVAAAMAETPAVCEQLHLPLQSGSDRILAAMHRGYSAARYLEKLAMAHRTIADLTVSTDIIVGFPGETDEDFAATLDAVAEARFDGAFTFQYSPRPGTPAATMDDQVPRAVIQERFDRLVALQNYIGLQRNQRLVGRTLEVMVEGPSRKDEAVVTSRTRGGLPLHVDGKHPAGSYLDVTVTRAAPHHLLGSRLP
ncbi:MAG: tRNA (N6-isopentenyl adenosine(37)-C2)-methylthiotransferase MiaB [Acidimicrobiia bacterium]|nr:tRNA (N6-isopentenyl adenosine(37)-C2)-methylthiotransferase MiaB [Acidimicrobiia bacterium]